MGISLKGIFEVKFEGNKIVLTYKTENDALVAYDEFAKENSDWVKQNFPNGVL